MCVGILVANVYEKFGRGRLGHRRRDPHAGGESLLIHRYYEAWSNKLARLNSLLSIVAPPRRRWPATPTPAQPTAAVLVGGYSGLGVHTMLNALRFGPGKFSNMIFLSVGIVDSGNFKGADAVEDLRKHTEEALDRYVDHARRLGMPAVGFMASAPIRWKNWNGCAWKCSGGFRGRFSSPAGWYFSATRGTNDCCTMKRPTRSSGGCSGMACRW